MEKAAAALRPIPVVFTAGAVVSLLGGMIGLGGAEFRLPLLISLFGFAALSAVILYKAMSLVVVLTALPARMATVPIAELGEHWTVAANLLAGSLLGAWAGAAWAVRMASRTLYRVLAVLLVLMAVACRRRQSGIHLFICRCQAGPCARPAGSRAWAIS